VRTIATEKQPIRFIGPTGKLIMANYSINPECLKPYLLHGVELEMRSELKRNTFNLWRKRVNSVVSQKHA